MSKVSIILPIYNVQEYLRECLESVCGQTLTDIEIICVNDGSTDNSLDIINEYAAKDKRIVVLSGPNGGYGKAMNKGLDCATGEYIGIVEPDDYVIPEMFDELYEIASKNDLDFVKADFYRFTRENGQENLKYEFLDRSKKRYGELLNPSQDPSCIRFVMNTWSGIYRNSFLTAYNIRHNETPGASYQDNGFFFQTFIYAERAMIINKPYYRNRRDNPNSSIKSKEKVYCVNVEYDFIRDIIKKDEAKWQLFKYMYWWKKYFNYIFTYNRIAPEYKKAYLERMQAEFKRAYELGELDKNLFKVEEWQKIEVVIKKGASATSKTYSTYDKLKASSICRAFAPYIPKPIKMFILKILSK